MIYKIIDNTSDRIYIGSTTKTLQQRLSNHKRHYKSYLAGKSTNYMTSFKILKNDDYGIELLEEVHFQNKRQLHERECYFIIKYADNAVNKCKPNAYNKVGKIIYGKKYRDKNRQAINNYKKSYRDKNRQAINNNQKSYYYKNREAISNRQKSYYEKNREAIYNNQNKICLCACGCTYRKVNKSHHMRSKKHKNLMVQNCISTINSIYEDISKLHLQTLQKRI
jgi:hypothetical protein